MSDDNNSQDSPSLGGDGTEQSAGIGGGFHLARTERYDLLRRDEHVFLTYINALRAARRENDPLNKQFFINFALDLEKLKPHFTSPYLLPLLTRDRSHLNVIIVNSLEQTLKDLDFSEDNLPPWVSDETIPLILSCTQAVVDLIQQFPDTTSFRSILSHIASLHDTRQKRIAAIENTTRKLFTLQDEKAVVIKILKALQKSPKGSLLMGFAINLKYISKSAAPEIDLEILQHLITALTEHFVKYGELNTLRQVVTKLVETDLYLWPESRAEHYIKPSLQLVGTDPTLRKTLEELLQDESTLFRLIRMRGINKKTRQERIGQIVQRILAKIEEVYGTQGN